MEPAFRERDVLATASAPVAPAEPPAVHINPGHKASQKPPGAPSLAGFSQSVPLQSPSSSALLEQGCSVLLVSDASGQMEAQSQPGNSTLSAIPRSNSILPARVLPFGIMGFDNVRIFPALGSGTRE